MQNEIITVLGKKGHGKTTLIKNRLIPRYDKPIFILDSNGEYSQGLIFRDSKDFHLYLIQGKTNPCGVYILRPKYPEDSENFFKIAYAIGNLTLIIDEVDKYCSPHYISPEFRAIINYGRHSAINVIAAARRAARVNSDLLSQSDYLVSFRQTGKNDLDAFRKIYDGIDGVITLNRYKYLIFGDGVNDLDI